MSKRRAILWPVVLGFCILWSAFTAGAAVYYYADGKEALAVIYFFNYIVTQFACGSCGSILAYEMDDIRAAFKKN